MLRFDPRFSREKSNNVEEVGHKVRVPPSLSFSRDGSRDDEILAIDRKVNAVVFGDRRYVQVKFRVVAMLGKIQHLHFDFLSGSGGLPDTS